MKTRILLSIFMLLFLNKLYGVQSDTTGNIILPSVEIKGIDLSQYNPGLNRKYKNGVLSDIEKQFIKKNEKKIEFIQKMNKDIYGNNGYSFQGKKLFVARAKTYLLNLSFFVNNYFYPNYEISGGYQYKKMYLFSKIRVLRGTDLYTGNTYQSLNDTAFKRASFVFSYFQDFKNKQISVDYNNNQVTTNIPFINAEENIYSDRGKVKFSMPVLYDYNTAVALEYGHSSIDRRFLGGPLQKYYYLYITGFLKKKTLLSGNFDLKLNYFTSFPKNYLIFNGGFLFKTQKYKNTTLKAYVKIVNYNNRLSINPSFSLNYIGGLYNFKAIVKTDRNLINNLRLNNYFMKDYRGIYDNIVKFSTILNSRLNLSPAISLYSNIFFNQFEQYYFLQEDNATNLLEYNRMTDFSIANLDLNIFYKYSSSFNTTLTFGKTLFSTKDIPFQPNISISLLADMKFFKKFHWQFKPSFKGGRYYDKTGKIPLNDLLELHNKVSYSPSAAIDIYAEMSNNLLNRKIYDNYMYPLIITRAGIIYKF